MTEEEADDLYRLLADALRENGLNTVVSEVENQVRAGKIVDVPIKDSNKDQSQVTFEIVEGYQVPGTRPKYIQRSETYTNKERLVLLIAGLEHAVLNTGDMAQAVLASSIPQGESEKRVIFFAPDNPDDDLFILEESQVKEKDEAQQNLRQLLNQLKDYVDAN